jgi:hypothetical protein
VVTLPRDAQLDEGVTFYSCVQGTHSWSDIPFKRLLGKRLWWQPGSPFTNYLAQYDLYLWQPEFPFVWDTELSGALLWRQSHRNWQAAAAHLVDRLSPVPFEDRNIVAHSHAIQIVMYACAYGLEIRNLITVGGPVRSDMRDASEIARRRIQFWLAVSDPDDKTQRQGEWFDGDEDWKHPTGHPLADVNDRIRAIGHSGVLYDAALIPIWTQQHWHEVLKLSHAPVDLLRDTQ